MRILAPVEPTIKMMIAGCNTNPQRCQHPEGARQVYQAMLQASPTPPAQERGYTLTISSELANPTRFKRGDRIEYDKKTGVTSSQMLVIGEDETHLHTFFTEGSSAGSYYGIAKKPENLEPLVTPPAPEAGPVAWRIDYVMEGAKRRALCGHNAIVDYRDIDSGATVTPLYTHLPNDGLRKAAEELMARLDSGSNCYTEKENLRAELNKAHTPDPSDTRCLDDGLRKAAEEVLNAYDDEPVKKLGAMRVGINHLRAELDKDKS